MRCLYISIFILCYLTPNIFGARILGIFPFNARSHWIFYQPLIVSLAERGHNVTVLGHFPIDNPPPTYKEISLTGVLETIEDNIAMPYIEDFGKVFLLLSSWVFYGMFFCDGMMKLPQMKDLVESDEEYDLIITELLTTECFIPFAHKFKVPYIGIISNSIYPQCTNMIDLPDNPSYVSTYNMPFSQNMNIFERTLNLIYSYAVKLGYYVISKLSTESTVRRIFPDMPPLSEISNNISLIITNSHFSLNGAKPGVPALVEVGGMHISEPKPLPTVLAKILDEAKEGVIYFSFGSMIRSETMSPKILKALVAAFGSQKETVLWKVNSKIPGNLTKNIITYPWLPQVDVLCHPNVKLFITHGGIGGTQESIYCGVPMIVIPLLADMIHNAINFAEQGISVTVPYDSITEDVIKNAINEVLNNPRYKLNVLHASILFKDRPQTPLETAIYWVEYVIRHKGAPQLRTLARNLNWIQYYLLDVLVMLMFIIVIATLLLRKLFMIFHSKKGKTKMNSFPSYCIRK